MNPPQRYMFISIVAVSIVYYDNTELRLDVYHTLDELKENSPEGDSTNASGEEIIDIWTFHP